MGRPDPRRPREGQIEMFEAAAVQQPDMVLRGRHSDTMDRALQAARDEDSLSEIDEGLATVLRAGAWALDCMESRNQSYGPAKIIDPLVNALREARMTPDSRSQAADDSIANLLEELAEADDNA